MIDEDIEYDDLFNDYKCPISTKICRDPVEILTPRYISPIGAQGQRGGGELPNIRQRDQHGVPRSVIRKSDIIDRDSFKFFLARAEGDGSWIHPTIRQTIRTQRGQQRTQQRTPIAVQFPEMKEMNPFTKRLWKIGLRAKLKKYLQQKNLYELFTQDPKRFRQQLQFLKQQRG